MLSVRNIEKAFGEVQALGGVSIDFRRGETTVILGSSGSGKSTLLRCLNLLEIPDAGELAFDDVSLRFPGSPSRIDKSTVRSHSAMVFQDFQLFPHLNLLGNVTLGPTLSQGVRKTDAEARGRALLEKVGLADRVDAFPYQLSGGQRQRVAIARALAMNPDYLLCDEPTSALDPELGAEVRRVLTSLAREGATLIVVTHDMHFARNVADRIVFLDKGSVRFDGDPSEFFSAPSQEIARFLAVFDA
ncbi:MAG: amino acid ABC transporter ATP-binding protein [Actinomycetaceae bacterium]|nr:amino acid ABC transporter ATP-binding protein [Arcanobacterium sp.]MDD7505081.1 amino acid ABC transporter ATP-binding protein [Actinomycetaceae bacterium]MDY6142598.1 amino acid ABC transporter ATP-binding protein [Arcanobacterium sp.]